MNSLKIKFSFLQFIKWSFILILLLNPFNCANKRRITQDGKLCSLSFVHDQTTYTDCTTSLTPDGIMTGREWCYLDPSYKSEPNWGFCLPDLDYDKIISKNFEFTKELIEKINLVNKDINSKINPALISFQNIEYIQSEQKVLETELGKFKNQLNQMDEIISNLKKQKEILDTKEKELNELKFNVNRFERERGTEKDLYNCKGMLLYEESDLGDGLIGKFYSNENFLGLFKEKKSESINYDWTGIEPLPGIGIDNFSVEWNGWIQIPITGNYLFTIECDDGAILYLDNQKIIDHHALKIFRENLNDNYSKETKADLFKEGMKADQNSNGENSMVHFEQTVKSKFKTTSKMVHLIGGIKLRIKLKYFHSIHTSLFSKEQNYIKLYWESEEWDEQIIPKDYLYSSYTYPLLKITGFSTDNSSLGKLTENDPAFIDSQTYILQDIPNEYNGLTQLKLKKLFQEGELELSISTPSSAYVAYISYYPNPLENDWEDTGRSMSLLQIENLNNKATKKLIAKKSAQLKIMKKKFKKGMLKIRFNKIGLNSKGIPLILFFGFDKSKGKEMLCTGMEKIISDSNSKSFKKCRASSQYEGYKCEDGFRNNFRDEEGSMWAAKNDGVGSWIEIYFDHYYEITKFKYKNRNNPSERNKQLELEFSNSQKILVDLKNNDDIVEIDIDSIKADSVKITIKQTYDSLNNGGAFAFYGVNCEDKGIEEKENDLTNTGTNIINNNSPIPPIFELNKKEIILLNCHDSLSNSDKFLDIDYSSQIIVKCPESCILSPGTVYGTGVYTKDSVICKSAYHDKKIPLSGGFLTMKIKEEKNDSPTQFIGSYSNGIKSYGKAKSPLSVTYEKYIKEDNILIKPGTKVEIRVKDNQNKYTWAPAVIIKLDETKIGKFIKVMFENENGKVVEYPYSRELIHPCGEHIKGRECKGSLKVLYKTNPVVFRFVPLGYISSSNFLSDFGEIFGTGKNKNYGWSVDMTNNIRTRGKFLSLDNMQSDSENTFLKDKGYLESFVEFPPSYNSIECIKPNPNKLCEPVSWRVKTGKGRFKVTVYAGDLNKDFQMDLRINNKILIKNKIIKKGNLEKFIDIIDDKNEYLELNSICEGNCLHSNTKLNAIEIEPIINESPEEEMENKKEKEVCIGSFIKGRCDEGPDVTNCIYDDTGNKGTKYCNDDKALVMIPENTNNCKEYIGYYKCVKKVFFDYGECERYCPKTCTSDGRCVY